MRLDSLSRGAVYVDTNILYMYLRADAVHLSVIKSFLKQTVRGDLEAYIGIPVLDELFYRLLLARIKDATGRNPLTVLRDDPVGRVAEFGDPIETAIRKLVALPHLNIVGVEPDDVDNFLKNIGMFSLLPRDALHLAIIQ